MSNMPLTLYHYCNSEKFCNIIGSSSIRLSDITNSNDYMEMLLLYDIVLQKALSVYQLNKFDLIYEDKTNEEALKSLITTNKSVHNSVTQRSNPLQSLYIVLPYDGRNE